MRYFANSTLRNESDIFLFNQLNLFDKRLLGAIFIILNVGCQCDKAVNKTHMIREVRLYRSPRAGMIQYHFPTC